MLTVWLMLIYLQNLTRFYQMIHHIHLIERTCGSGTDCVCVMHVDFRDHSVRKRRKFCMFYVLFLFFFEIVYFSKALKLNSVMPVNETLKSSLESSIAVAIFRICENVKVKCQMISSKINLSFWIVGFLSQTRAGTGSPRPGAASAMALS